MLARLAVTRRPGKFVGIGAKLVLITILVLVFAMHTLRFIAIGPAAIKTFLVKNKIGARVLVMLARLAVTRSPGKFIDKGAKPVLITILVLVFAMHTIRFTAIGPAAIKTFLVKNKIGARVLVMLARFAVTQRPGKFIGIGAKLVFIPILVLVFAMHIIRFTEIGPAAPKTFY